MTLEKKARAVIAEGSKSFSFASALFSRQVADAVALLYWWLRDADDRIDAAPSPEEARRQAALLHEETEALYGPPREEGLPQQAMRKVVTQYDIPSHYPRELVLGMMMDVDGTHYETLADLSLYCYRVAGVVGAMMAHIMGLSDARAMRHAIALGHAFQLTNIARDVADDKKLGRTYVPAALLREHGLVRAVDRMLVAADTYYADAKKGLMFLPLRAAFAIAVALRVYREIGQLVRARGERAWDERARVPLWRKLGLAVLGVFDVLVSLPKRPRFARVKLGETWRHTT